MMWTWDFVIILLWVLNSTRSSSTRLQKIDYRIAAAPGSLWSPNGGYGWKGGRRVSSGNGRRPATSAAEGWDSDDILGQTFNHLSLFPAVVIGQHRLMFRPRDSYDQRLIASSLTIDPKPPTYGGVHDVFGNCVTV